MSVSDLDENKLNVPLDQIFQFPEKRLVLGQTSGKRLMRLLLEERSQAKPGPFVDLAVRPFLHFNVAEEIHNVLECILQAGLYQIQVFFGDSHITPIVTILGEVIQASQGCADGVEVGNETGDLRGMFGQRIAQHPEASCHILCVVGRCAQCHCEDHTTGPRLLTWVLPREAGGTLYTIGEMSQNRGANVDQYRVLIENIGTQKNYTRGGTAQMFAIRSSVELRPG